MSYWKPIALGSAILGAIGIAVLVSRKKTLPTAQRVALIGDSYAVGLGPELAKIFPVFKYEGHVGTTAAQWAAHSPACGQCGDWLTAFKPDVVIISLGVNDGASLRVESYNRLLQGVYGLGARVVWVEPPAPVSSNVHNVLASAARTSNDRIVPPTNAPLAADGLHPQRYDRWAEEIKERAA
jgi:hypothetical protein